MAYRTRIRSLAFSLALLAPAMSGCERQTLVGHYTATSFTYATSGSATNVLAAGGSIDLTISADLTTGGTMRIPASVTGNGEVFVSLLGTAAREGDLVTLNLVADSILQGMKLTFDGSTLEGTRVVNGVAVVITLSK